MHNPFQQIKKIEVRSFASLPAKYRKKQRTSWSDPNRQLAALDSFLEGFKRYFPAEVEKWRGMVRKANLKLE